MTTARDILDDKGHDVFAVAPGDTVLDALQLLADKGVGALLVMEADKLVGIFTERDYARKVILAGKASRDTPISEVMTAKVLYVGPDRTVDECMVLMTDIKARHLPVLEGETVLGVLSIGDLVRVKIREQSFLIDQLRQYIAG
ncbi:MAG: CBS domain-containing protein [Pseudomonadota bacterium]